MDNVKRIDATEIHADIERGTMTSAFSYVLTSTHDRVVAERDKLIAELIAKLKSRTQKDAKHREAIAEMKASLARCMMLREKIREERNFYIRENRNEKTSDAIIDCLDAEEIEALVRCER